MAIDPISGAVIAEPGIAPPSASGVSQFIDQIGSSLNQIVQLWATPTPPAGSTYAPPPMLGGIVPLLLLAGGVYLLTRTGGRSYRRNPTRRYRVRRMAAPGRFDPRSFRTVRLPGGRLLTVGCPRGHWGPHTQRCAVGTRGQRIMTPKRRNPHPYVTSGGAMFT